MATVKGGGRSGRAWQAVVAARKLVILVVGGTLVLLGIALLVLPGPGILVVIGGLAVLSIEFSWAATLLERTRERARKQARHARERARARRNHRQARRNKRHGEV